MGRLGAWSLDVPGLDVEWADESRSILGYAKGAPLSWQQALAHLEEPYRTELQRAVVDCAERGQAFGMEARAVTAEGRSLWLRIEGEPEPEVTGPTRRVLGVTQDISERKEDARRFQQLSEQLATTFESITEGFFTVDREGRFTYLNHETERVAKRSRTELIGRTIAEVFPWYTGSRFQAEYERALAEGRRVQFEAFAMAMGVWVDVYAYPSPQGLAVYFQDITERKAAHEALRASEERHRLLFEASLDAVFRTDRTGTVLSANAAACEMFRLTEAQLCERGRHGIVAPRDPRLRDWLEVLERTGKGRGHLTMVRGDGEEFEAEVSAASFKASNGVTYAKVVIRDISQILKYQAEILALNEGLAQKVRERTAELEAANTELKAFAHSLAHDLRAPIAAIDGFGLVLEERLAPAAERERQYVARIRQAAQQLDDYVEALLSQAWVAQATLRATHVDLSAMAQGILADFRERDPERNVMAHVQTGLHAFGDATLLRMALENLLGNAWKFTGNRPLAEIRFAATGQEQGFTTFCVSDNGAGFVMDYAHKLFGTFQRLHTQAEFPGTGVGLANVQRIVTRHGGRIWATGEEGVGASFHFTLPLRE